MTPDIPLNAPCRTITPGIPTPTWGPSPGNFTIAVSLSISAPPPVCLAVVIDDQSYLSWNRFCRRVEIDSTPLDTPATTRPPVAEKTAATISVSPFLKEAIDLVPGSNDTKVEPGAKYAGLASGIGTKFRLQVHLNLESESYRMEPQQITILEAFSRRDNSVEGDGGQGREERRGLRVGWKWRGMPEFLQRCERIQEFVEDGEGGTVYQCWETFYGMLAPVTRMVVGGQIEKGFAAWGEGLKGEAERRWEEKRGGEIEGI